MPPRCQFEARPDRRNERGATLLAATRDQLFDRTITVVAHLKHSLALVDARILGAPEAAARHLTEALERVERDAALIRRLLS